MGGIKHGAACAGHILKAFQRGFAGISAGGNQYADFPLFLVFLRGQTDQIRQQFQRDILKRQRGAVKQLQNIYVAVQTAYRRDGRIVKRRCGIGSVNGLLDLTDGIIFQKTAQNPLCDLLITHLAERGDFLLRKLGKHRGHI